MSKDILVILMMAFGLFAILMFILFYVYAKKYYNNKHLIDDIEDNDDNETEEEIELVDILINDQMHTFDANDTILEKDDKIKLLMDNEVCDGVVVKANYKSLVSKLEEKPRLLFIYQEQDDEPLEEKINLKEVMDNIDVKVINSDEDQKLESIDDIKKTNNYDEGEFIPKKKK